MQFTKLFSSILDSTIWQEPAETKILWITMLAMADRGGEVHASIPGLAKRAGITLSQCEAGLSCLMSPDKYSRTPDFEGRRLAEIEGGWQLLNHGKYRQLLSVEERREYQRRKQAQYREQKRLQSFTHVPEKSSSLHSTEAEAEAEAEADTKKKKKSPSKARPSNQKEVVDYATEIGLPTSDGRAFWDGKEANGWKNGSNAIKDWKATMRNWKANGYHPSQKGGGKANPNQVYKSNGPNISDRPSMFKSK